MQPFSENVTPLFDKANFLLQVQAPQVHILRCILTQLLEDSLTRFIQSGALKGRRSLLTVTYTVGYGDVEVQKDDEDVVIGSLTYPVVDMLGPREK